jgi:hypothetical protein
MNGFGRLFSAPMWMMALLLAVLVAACGGGNGEEEGTSQPTAAGAGTGVGGAGRGPAPVNLQTAGNFALLAEAAITNLPASSVTGDVGLNPASGADIGLTCEEVTGVIYTRDAAGPPCRVTDRNRLTEAVADGVTAFFDAKDRVPDYIDLGGGNIGGLNLGPGTYQWNAGVVIPRNLTLTGGPNDVWIFQIWQLGIDLSLSVGPGVEIVLAGGALPQHVYWEINNAELGTNSRFKGVMLADNAIVMGTGASIVGRVLAGSVASLDHNTLVQPGP